MILERMFLNITLLSIYSLFNISSYPSYSNSFLILYLIIPLFFFSSFCSLYILNAKDFDFNPMKLVVILPSHSSLNFPNNFHFFGHIGCEFFSDTLKSMW